MISAAVVWLVIGMIVPRSWMIVDSLVDLELVAVMLSEVS